MMKEVNKVNAVQRKNSQMEFESKEIVSKIEISINPTIESEQSENIELSSHPNQISILIADDDEFYFGYIKTILTSSDYNIFHANDGQEAVNIYQANNDIRLILMDIQMPVMNGFDATKEIRKTDTVVPIIAQTSHTINGVKEKAIKAGCNEFLIKPTEPKILTKKIANYLKLTYPNLTY